MHDRPTVLDPQKPRPDTFEELLAAVRNDCERILDGKDPPNMTTEDMLRGFADMITLRLAKPPLLLVMQQGGSTLEWYSHLFDTQAETDAFVESCAKAAYTTVGPFKVPSDSDHPEFYELMKQVVEACVEVA